MAKKKTAQKTTKTADVEENRQVAALSYIWVLVLIPLLTKRDSEFAQFHAKQGLILFIIEILAGFVFWIPIVGQLIALGLLIVAIVGAVKSLNGNWWKIPYIYEWSKKIKL
jgi:uncharacterized membrane protein